MTVSETDLESPVYYQLEPAPTRRSGAWSSLPSMFVDHIQEVPLEAIGRLERKRLKTCDLVVSSPPNVFFVFLNFNHI